MTKEKTKVPSFVYTPNIYKESKNYVIVDFETTTIEKGSALESANELVLACWTVVRDNTEIRKHKFGTEYEQFELLSDVQSADFVVAQNAKFEFQWLKRCGLELRSSLPADTMLAEWVLVGNQRTPLSLEELSKSYLGSKFGKSSVVSSLIKAGVDVRDIPRDWLLEYCENDVWLTHEVFKRQLKELVRKDQLHLFHTRNLTCACLADIEFNGLTLDKERVSHEYTTTRTKMELAESRLAAISGGINYNSPQQIGEYLYGTLGFQELLDRAGRPLRTSSGRKKSDADTIKQLRCVTPEQEEFKKGYTEYRELSSALSKYLTFFKAICDERNGEYYGSINQCRTATHRLASSGRPVALEAFGGEAKGVQLQNVPREYLHLHRARKDGHEIGVADEAQLEFRVACDLTKDPVAWEEIATDVDVHEITKLAFHQKKEMISRQEAKAQTFKPLFLGKGKTKAEQHYCKFFKNKYDVLHNEQVRWTYEVLADKKLRTRYGMEYYWPGCKLSNGWVEFSTQISNAPINIGGLIQQ